MYFLCQLILITTSIIGISGLKPRIFVGGDFDSQVSEYGTIKLYGLGIWDDQYQYWTDLNGGLKDRTIYHNSSNPSNNDNIYASYWDKDLGLLFIGGKFSKIASVTSPNIAAYDIDNRTWTGLTDSCDGVVKTIVGTPYGIAVGGSFSSINNQNIQGLALLSDFQWKSLNINGVITKAAYSNDHLFVIGSFSSVGGVSSDSNFAAYNFASSSWTTLNAVICGVPSALQVLGNYLYIGGDFSSFGTAPCPSKSGQNLAQFSLQRLLFTDTLRLNLTSPIAALAANGDNLLVVSEKQKLDIRTNMKLYYPAEDTFEAAVWETSTLNGVEVALANEDCFYFGGNLTDESNIAEGVRGWSNSTGNFLWSSWKGLGCSYCPATSTGGTLASRPSAVHTMSLLPSGSPNNQVKPPTFELIEFHSFEDYNIPPYPGSSVLYGNDTNYEKSELGDSRPKSFYWQTWSVIGSAIFVGSLLLATALHACVRSEEF